jgi:hypothetical protein
MSDLTLKEKSYLRDLMLEYIESTEKLVKALTQHAEVCARLMGEFTK